jgi:hypothetical protein
MTVGDEMQLKALLAEAQRYSNGPGGLLANTLQRLFDDPVGSEIDSGGQRSWLTEDAQLDWLAPFPLPLDEGVDLIQAGLRLEFTDIVDVTQDAEHPAHLREYLATSVFGGAHRSVGSYRVEVEQAPGRFSLDDHRSNTLRHHSMELTSDSRAFTGDDQTCTVFAFDGQASGHEFEI